MARRILTHLPTIFRTTPNKKFLNATLEQLVDDPQLKKINGFIGRKNTLSFKKTDNYLTEITKDRSEYQLEPSIVVKDGSTINFTATYNDLLDSINFYGGNISDHDRLFRNEYYSYDGQIDYDKFINYSHYFWVPEGPDAVLITSGAIPLSNDFDVTRDTLTRSYKISSFPVTDLNPTVILARGGSYTFNVDQVGYNFWIQADSQSDGFYSWQNNLSSREVYGVTNNGEDLGTVTFTVPEKDAQDWLLQMPSAGNVGIACGFSFAELHNKTYSEFLEENKNIDGVTDLDGKYIIFIDNSNNTDDWSASGIFDDYLDPFDASTFDGAGVVAVEKRRGIWQFQVDYNYSIPKIKIRYIQDVDSDNKVFVQSGTVYGYRYFRKTTSDTWVLIPPITANLDVLYYRDSDDENMVGIIRLVDLNDVTPIDVEVDIIGKKKYTSINGVVFTNGLKVRFDSSVKPVQYQNNEYYVEGVGEAIRLIKVDELITPETYIESSQITWDMHPWDSTLWEQTSAGPINLDYLTINRGSKDQNPWSRSNRWFHIDVINATATYNNYVVELDINNRAKRPIIEFKYDTQLFDFGYIRKEPVHLIDTVTTDVFSSIEGQTEYTIDGIEVTDGLRVIFTNDNDDEVRNKTYVINFIELFPAASPQIHLSPADDVDPILNDSVVIILGSTNQGKSYRFDGTNWSLAQQKIDINQEPIFDIFDLTGVSFSNTDKYPSTTFAGTKLFSYKKGTGNKDSNLGFALSYKNIANLGDIVFENNYDKDTFTYVIDNTTQQEDINSGVIHATLTNSTYVEKSCWIKTIDESKQYQIFSYVYDATSDNTLFLVGKGPVSSSIRNNIKVYLNNQFLNSTEFTFSNINDRVYVQLDVTLADGDKVDIFVYNNELLGFNSFYQIPKNLEINAVNKKLESYTLGQFRNHVKEVYESSNETIGDYPGASNLRDLPLIKNIGGSILQHSAPMILSPLFMCNKEINFIDAVDFAAREYTKFKNRLFDSIYNTSLCVEDPINGLDEVLKKLNDVKTTEFPFYYSDMVPYGDNKTIIDYTISNVLDKIYDLSITFSLDRLSNQGVIVYHTSKLKRDGTITTSEDGVGTISISSGTKTVTGIGTTFTSNDIGKIILDPIGNQIGEIVNVTDPLNATLFLNSPLTLTSSQFRLTSTTIIGINTDFTDSDVNKVLYSDSGEKIGTIISVLSETEIEIDALPLVNVFNDAFRLDIAKNQLIYNIDYTFYHDRMSIELSDSLQRNIDDVISIVQYLDTDGNWIPETPTKVGLWPKFKPSKYLDTTYVDPIYVIQGHDGSITPAFNDFRDDVILEYENRIYNNIKVNYTLDKLSMYDIVPGAFRETDYTKDEINQIISKQFVSWAGNYKLDYTEQIGYNGSNPWTYNYKNFADKLTASLLQGSWRAVFKHFYDTDRPHIAPWEMLGFSEQPDWWIGRYGDAPYSSGNLVLWNDLRDGIIYAGPRQGTDVKFARPDLISIIPVDENGNLKDPVEIFVSNFNSSKAQAVFSAGEIGPVENAWRRNSAFPYAMQIVLALTKPAKYFGLNIGAFSYIKNNTLDEFVVRNIVDGNIVEEKRRIRIDDYKINGLVVDNEIQRSASYANWIIEFLINNGVAGTTYLKSIFDNLQINLAYKMSGFTDKDKLKVKLEQSSPTSSTKSILVPEDNIYLALNRSHPVSRIVYSAIVIEKTNNGYKVSGYDLNNPYFTIIPSLVSNNKTQISVFDTNVTIYKDYDPIKALIPYGTEFASKQQVVDFLISHQRYLQSQGILFQEFDKDLGENRSFILSSKEFILWANQNWNNNMLLSLNPLATKFRIITNQAVVDEVNAQRIKGTKVLDINFNYLRKNQLSIERIGNDFTIETINNESMALIDLSLVQYEHMLVFDNNTIFSDVIYEPESGSRQTRVKLDGWKTLKWDGSLSAPGFIYNSDSYQEWKAGTDYKKGTLLKFKGQLFSAIKDIIGTVDFDYASWKLLDEHKIKTGLLPSFSTLATQIENAYDINSMNLSSDIDTFSKGILGYRNRNYLYDLGIDDISQLRFYQGFIKEKGTLNSINGLIGSKFDSITSGIDVYENWALRVGEYGAIDSNGEVEVILPENNSLSNPIVVEFLNDTDTKNNEFILVKRSDLYKIPKTYQKNLFLTTYDKVTLENEIKSAGYVKFEDIDGTIFDIENLSTYVKDAFLSRLGVGFKLWIAKDLTGNWDVLRASETTVKVTQIDNALNGTVSLTTNFQHNLQKDDYVVLKNFDSVFDNIYRIEEVIDLYSFTVKVDEASVDLDTFESMAGLGILFKFETVRFERIQDFANYYPTGGWKDNDIALIDEYNKDILNSWTVYKKSSLFNLDNENNHILGRPVNGANHDFGNSCAFLNDGLYFLAGAPNESTGKVYIYKLIDGTYTYLTTLTGNETASISGISKFGWAIKSVPSLSTTFDGNETVFDVNFNDSMFAVTAPETDSNKGAIVIYRISSGDIVTKFATILPSVSNAYAGYSLDISPSGILVAGRPNNNDVLVYYYDGATFTLATTITSTDSLSNDRFGHSVSVSDNGERIVIGAPLRDYGESNSGAVYLFEQMSESFVADGAAVQYSSGISVSASSIVTVNDVIMDYGIDWTTFDADTIAFTTAPAVGSIVNIKRYTYNQIKRIVPSVSEVEQQFGTSVKISKDGSYIFIGSPNADITSSQNINAGQVYKFTDNGIRYNEVIGTVTSPTVTATQGFRINNFPITFSNTTLASVITDINNASIPGITAENYNNKLKITADPLLTSMGVTIGFQAKSPYTSTGLTDLGLSIYDETQILQDPGKIDNDHFGRVVEYDDVNEILYVGSDLGATIERTTYDSNSTTFDNDSLDFKDTVLSSGAVYVFENIDEEVKNKDYPAQFVFAQYLEPGNIKLNDFFGRSIAISDEFVAVGAPGSDVLLTTDAGAMFIFNKNQNKSWTIQNSYTKKVNINAINRVYLYNSKTNEKLLDLDFIDPLKGKVLGSALQEIDYVSSFDPGKYNVSTLSTNKPNVNYWAEKEVGTVWWDTSTVRYVEYEQGDNTYRNSSWAQTFPGSSIDVYEWTKSYQKPSTYVDNGGNGIPKYENDEAYVALEELDKNTAQAVPIYFYWVKNKTVVEGDIKVQNSRSLTTEKISNYISNPRGYGLPYAAFINENSVSVYNVNDKLVDNDVILHIDYDVQYNKDVIHSEFQLLQENSSSSMPNDKLWKKMTDSLVGLSTFTKDDIEYNYLVPDPSLNASQKYGISIRPRQSIVIDRFSAIKTLLQFVNSKLTTYQLVNDININPLYGVDPMPSELSGLYDEVVSSYQELGFIDITTKPYGHRVLVRSDSNYNGRWSMYQKNNSNQWVFLRKQEYALNDYWSFINWVDSSYDVTQIPKYVFETKNDMEASTFEAGAIIKVNNNGTGNYEIYKVNDDLSKTLVVLENGTIEFSSNLWSAVSFDTVAGTITSYSKITGSGTISISEGTKAVSGTSTSFSIADVGKKLFSSNNEEIGTIIKVTSATAAQIDYYSPITVNGAYKISNKVITGVGTQFTTNDVGKNLYSTTGKFLGQIETYTSATSVILKEPITNDVNGVSYLMMDDSPQYELRMLLDILINKIWNKGDTKIYSNELIFVLIRYVLREQKYVDWLFKTSFIDIVHNIRKLEQISVYEKDNQDYLRSYIEEIKPYHTKIREYLLNYTGEDEFNGDITDFDLPAYYDSNLDIYRSPSGEEEVDDELLSTLPQYSMWYNNYTKEIISIDVINSGSGYVSQPEVVITGGGGSGVIAEADIANGEIIRIIVKNGGSGFWFTPTVTITGGGGSGAEVYPILGNYLGPTVGSTDLTRVKNTTVRTIKTIMKFDRTGYDSTVYDWSSNTYYTAGQYITYNSKLYRVDYNFTTGTTFLGSNLTLLETNDLASLKQPGIGTITANTQSAIITGNNTNFTPVDVNKYIYNLDGILLGQVATFTNATAITLSANSEVGVTGSDFLILDPNFGTANDRISAFYQTANKQPSRSLIVKNISISNNGTNYASVPNISISGGNGYGAQAVAKMKITSATINNGGTGYIVGDVLNPAPQVGEGQTNAVILVATVNGSGTITGITLSNSGQYINPPTLTGVSLISNLYQTGTGSITVSNTSNSVVGTGTSFSNSYVGRNIYGPSLDLIGTITSVTNATVMTLTANSLMNFTSSSFKTNSAGANATVNLTMNVDSVSILNNGIGYISAPTVSFSGGSPNVAAIGTAVLQTDLRKIVAGIEYPGVKVDGIDFNIKIVGTGNITANASSMTVTGSGTTFTKLNQGDQLFSNIGSEIGIIGFILNDTTLTLTSNSLNTYAGPFEYIDSNTYDNIIQSEFTDEESVSQIQVDGSEFVDTYHSHAPEEFVPGRLFDTLNLQVFTSPTIDFGQGAGPTISAFNYLTNGTETEFEFIVPGINSDGLLVYTDNLGYRVLNTDYTVDYFSKKVIFNIPPLANDIVSITAINHGGNYLITDKVFTGDGSNADFNMNITSTIIADSLVFVNGEKITDFTINTVNNVAVFHLNSIPPVDAYIHIYVYSQELTSREIYTQVKIGTDTIIDLDRIIRVKGPLSANILVSVDGKRLRPNNNEYYISDGIATVYSLPTINDVDNNTVSDSDISVYVDGILISTGDYSIAGAPKEVTFNSPPADGAEVIISVSTNSQFIINTINDVSTLTITDTSIVMTPITKTVITSFANHDSANIKTKVYQSTSIITTTRNIGFDEVGFDFTFVVGNIGTISTNHGEGGTITANIQSNLVSGVGTGFSSSDIGKILYDSSNNILGTITSVGGLTSVTLGANALANVTAISYNLASNLVVGSGSSFSASDVGKSIVISNNTVVGTIASVIDVTHVRLYNDASVTLTGSSYTLHSGFDSNSVTGISLPIYPLIESVSNINYVFVSLNGIKLTPNVDFILINGGTQLQLSDTFTISNTDTIIITQFTENVQQSIMGYRIFKDMNDNYNYFRISAEESALLVSNLTLADTEIVVSDAGVLPTPNTSANLPGVVFINGERIVYWQKDNNTNILSQIRRSTAGTGAPEIHIAGSRVIDASESQRIPGTIKGKITPYSSHEMVWYNAGSGHATDGNGLQASTTTSAAFIKQKSSVLPG